MARSRSLPTNLFDDPHFFELSSDTQSILLGLLLNADDAGRGRGHTGLLARKFNKEVHLVEQALHELEKVGMLQCYHVEREDYYSLVHWLVWETLSKPTPSKFPPPPPREYQETPGDSSNSHESPGETRETPLEGEEEKEQEEKGKGTVSEDEEGTPPNVVFFPSPSADVSLSQDEKLYQVTVQVANILKLEVSEALQRIVSEYVGDISVSLLGEADAAREWIDDKRRNRNGQRMSPAFFRRWLKREQESYLERHKRQMNQANGTTGMSPRRTAIPSRSGSRGEPATSSSEAEDPYEAFVRRRALEVSTTALTYHPKEETSHGTPR